MRRLQGCSGLLAVTTRSPRRCLSCGHRGNSVTSGALVGTALFAGRNCLREPLVGLAPPCRASSPSAQPIGWRRRSMSGRRFGTRHRRSRCRRVDFYHEERQSGADPAGLVGCVEEAAVRGWAEHRSRPSGRTARIAAAPPARTGWRRRSSSGPRIKQPSTTSLPEPDSTAAIGPAYPARGGLAGPQRPSGRRLRAMAGVGRVVDPDAGW